jgi:hypothetical protein
MKKITARLLTIIMAILAMMVIIVKFVSNIPPAYMAGFRNSGILRVKRTCAAMGRELTEMNAIIGCLAPVDVSTAAWTGKPINTSNNRRVTFLVYLGVATSCTGVITVEAGSTAALATSGGTAVACRFRKATTGAAAYSVLDGGDLTFPAAGITLGTDSIIGVGTPTGKIIAIEVRDTDLSTYGPYVAVKATGTASAVACIIAICGDYRYPQAIPGNTIT